MLLMIVCLQGQDLVSAFYLRLLRESFFSTLEMVYFLRTSTKRGAASETCTGVKMKSESFHVPRMLSLGQGT
jgi:hypothetical protein